MPARVLIADDDPVHVQLMVHMFERWGLDLETHTDGLSALESITSKNPPHVAVLDWHMPGIDGLELCRRAKSGDQKTRTFLFMLTGRDERQDIVAALEAGADDFLSKPAHKDELRARILNAVRMVDLQLTLDRRVKELEEAMANVKLLQGLLPICSYCKSIRDDDNYWQKVEGYLAEHSGLKFSHGICPHCFDTIVEPQLRSMGR